MTTPPDAHGADDSAQHSGEPAWRPTGAVPFSDLPDLDVAPGAPSGAVPFADPPGTGALPFSDIPEMDAAPPPGSSALPAPSWPASPPRPPGVAVPREPDAPARTSRAAVIALVTGLLGLVPLALGFGIAALAHRRRGTRKGKRFAIVGIAASAAWSAAIAVLLPTALEAVFSVERDESGAISEPGTTLFSVLRKGDCFTGYDFTGRLRLVTAVPCTEPHTGEVVMRTALPDGPWPGDDRSELAARVACGRATLGLRKSTVYPVLEPYFEWPGAVAWKTGDRQVTCAMHHDGELEGPLAGTVNTKLRTYDELTRWRCIRTWVREKHPHLTPVSCAKPHFAQVFATYEIEPELAHDPLEYPPHPGLEALKPRVLDRCEAHAMKTWPRPPRSDLEIFAIPPSPYDWESGIRTVVCMLSSPGKPLKGSLAPG